MADHLASWMLQRIQPTKSTEERRLLDGFLDRLSLVPEAIEKSESPDFFVRFGSADRVTVVACEIVRFHSLGRRADAAGLGHINRWKRFAERLRSALQENGFGDNYGAIHPKGDSRAAFDALLRRPDESIREIVALFQRRRVRTGIIRSFRPATYPVLSMSVHHISLSASSGDLWWYSTLQAGLLADPMPDLIAIVAEKQRKARSWNWRDAAERWLVVVGEAQSLEDTLVLDHDSLDGRLAVSPSDAGFSRVFAWDGYFEQIHQLLPTVGLLFEVEERWRNTLHSMVYPQMLKEFCPLLRNRPAP